MSDFRLEIMNKRTEEIIVEEWFTSLFTAKRYVKRKLKKYSWETHHLMIVDSTDPRNLKWHHYNGRWLIEMERL